MSRHHHSAGLILGLFKVIADIREPYKPFKVRAPKQARGSAPPKDARGERIRKPRRALGSRGA